MTSFRRRESAKQQKRKTGKRDNEFNDSSRHYVNKVRKMMAKDKSDKYKQYDSEDI